MPRELTNDGPSREEFRDFSNRVYTTIDAGFKELNARLEAFNNFAVSSAVDRENLRTRVISLEKEVFRGRTFRHPDQSARFTKREGALIGFGLAIIVTLLKLLELLGGKAIGAMLGAATRR